MEQFGKQETIPSVVNAVPANRFFSTSATDGIGDVLDRAVRIGFYRTFLETHIVSLRMREDVACSAILRYVVGYDTGPIALNHPVSEILSAIRKIR